MHVSLSHDHRARTSWRNELRMEVLEFRALMLFFGSAALAAEHWYGQVRFV